MKVAIIGGNAQSTPTLFAYLRTIPEVPVLRLVLIGRNPNTLKAVARAGAVLLENTNIGVEYARLAPENLHAALEGADIVILQARIGGYAGRDFDETFPLKYGICGDEGLGPGGLSAAWRSWPTLRQILEQVNHLAPKSLLILLTSPVGILSRAATLSCDNLKVAGICELPWVTLNQACTSLGVDVREISYDYLGVNHLGWFHHVRLDDRDLVREYADSRRQLNTFPSEQTISKYSGIPTKYLDLQFNARKVFEKQSLQRSRAAALQVLSEKAFSVFSQGSREEILSVLNDRPAPWYPHAIGPLLLAWAGVRVTNPFFLSVQNEGFWDRLNQEDILEIPHRIGEKEIKRSADSQAVPDEIAALVSEFVTFERSASRAVMERDVSGLSDALAVHPWVTDVSKVPDMIRDIVGERG